MSHSKFFSLSFLHFYIHKIKRINKQNRSTASIEEALNNLLEQPRPKEEFKDASESLDPIPPEIPDIHPAIKDMEVGRLERIIKEKDAF